MRVRLSLFLAVAVAASGCATSGPSLSDRREAQRDYLDARGASAESVDLTTSREAEMDSLRTADPQAYAERLAMQREIDQLSARLDRTERRAERANTLANVLMGLQVAGVAVIVLLTTSQDR